MADSGSQYTSSKKRTVVHMRSLLFHVTRKVIPSTINGGDKEEGGNR
jgi:hypothetical protein